jgi:hypothetical protein
VSAPRLRTVGALVLIAALIAVAALLGYATVRAASPSPSRGASPAASAAEASSPAGPSPFLPVGRTLRVPSAFVDVTSAIAASQPGDVILIAPGTYPGGIEVPQDKPGITIRGEDRNSVVFDGEDLRPTAIEVSADGVTLENLTAHDFTANGFEWESVHGFAGRYLTVWNVGLYGIYAISSRDGVIEDSYVSAAADAGFSIGECQPCDATIRRVTATLSAVGYSGTNAGGNLVVEDSHFLLDGVGILPNSYDVGLQPPPQRDAIFRRNEVVGTGTVVTPRTSPLAGFHGVGIGIAGGQGNLVEDNDVRGSARYGIAVFTAVDSETNWFPARNHVNGNRVSDSGIADLALSGGSGQENCFQGNVAGTALPAGIADTCSSFGTTDPKVEADLVKPPRVLLIGLPVPPAFSDMTPPGPQPTMPLEPPIDVATPATSRASSAVPDSLPPLPAPSEIPVAASGETAVLAASVLIVALFAVVILLVAYRVVPRRR